MTALVCPPPPSLSSVGQKGESGHYHAKGLPGPPGFKGRSGSPGGRGKGGCMID